MGAGPTTIEQVSRVAASAQDVWDRVTTPAGINDELRPYLRMTVPAGAHGLSVADVQPGTHLGRSWLLLFGLLPIDADDIVIAEIGPGFRFLERSSMLTMQRWAHERTVAPTDRGCEVRDRITFRLRTPLRWIPGSEALLARGLSWLFAHRHRRLARHFRPG